VVANNPSVQETTRTVGEMHIMDYLPLMQENDRRLFWIGSKWRWLEVATPHAMI
jgi:hypothetical protein